LPRNYVDGTIWQRKPNCSQQDCIARRQRRAKIVPPRRRAHIFGGCGHANTRTSDERLGSADDECSEGLCRGSWVPLRDKLTVKTVCVRFRPTRLSTLRLATRERGRLGTIVLSALGSHFPRRLSFSVGNNHGNLKHTIGDRHLRVVFFGSRVPRLGDRATEVQLRVMGRDG
jgi:hypothetical protein